MPAFTAPLSSRLHLAGPLNNMGITGRLDITDVHRWDMMPGNSQGWRQQILGRLDLMASRSNCTPPPRAMRPCR